ncbi:hypothetical protein BDV34DRAFT_183740 [Aspergillus parasiticus]|uniref:Uncharacterized protein n=1 Tax=Aspergillus parasiticus TaxID=5067 RepID=A0A5N6E622_ASPPA|nr:hypothetical protein BDV34DRAFT_183740 [Aspergillus parasiticus]
MIVYAKRGPTAVPVMVVVQMIFCRVPSFTCLLHGATFKELGYRIYFGFLKRN